jgi:hypothetical protein
MVQIGVRGPQDCWVLAPNDHTFWKAAYARHTNFAMTELQVPFESHAGFGHTRITARLRRAGDLLAQVYKYDQIAPISYDGPLVYDLTAVPISAAWYTDAIGNSMINNVEIQIGNHQFDRHTGEYMEIMSAMMDAPERLLGEMIGKYATIVERIFAGQNTQRLYTPLKFWFCRFHEQALPMIGLYWHDVTVMFDQRPITDLYHTSGGATGHTTVVADPVETYLIGNYVYLDKPERASFASGKHEYLFDQLQFMGEDTHVAATTVQQHSIRFNHPVQEIIWVCQRDALVTGGPAAGNNWFEYHGVPFNESGFGPTHDTDAFETATILLNNHERTMDHFAAYYRLVQPWERHTRNLAHNRWIYSYAFGLRPEHLMDTGSVNMSRMDNAVLRITYPSVASGRSWDGRTRVYARSKNLAKNCIGMMGIKFAA